MNFYDALALMRQSPVIITDGKIRLSVRVPGEQNHSNEPQLCIEQGGNWLATMPQTYFFETDWRLIDTNDQ
ncbi:hypothetical protein C7M52_00447 [Mixta theicola]|nr:hypothetical protein [Mixta theicola]QHM74512.1 hypothetical protein C7M52_00447 [Mixta theicola]